MGVNPLIFMPFALWVLVAGFIGGQLTALPLFAGARLSLLDAAVIGVLLYGVSQTGKKRFIPRLWMPIIGFSVVALVSLGVTVGSVPLYVVGGGLLYIIRWVSFAALYWVAASRLIRVTTWQTLLVGSGVVMALLGLVQYMWYPDLRNLAYLGWDPHYQRLFSTLFDPNFTGIILAFTALTLLSWCTQKKRNMWWLSGVMVTLTSLILTYSRSSLIAFFVGLVVWGIYTKRKALVGGLVVLVAIALLVLPSTGEGRNLFRTVSAYARIGSMERAISLIREKPLTGHGFNILRFVARDRSWIDESVAPSRAGAGLDTSLFFVGATTGVIGMVIYGWLLARLFQLGLVGLRGKEQTKEEAATYIAILSAAFIHSLFINSLFYPWVMMWLWIATGTLEQRVTAGK